MKYLITLVILFLTSSCGVKSKPLPPIDPVPLGKGEPSYSTATQDLPLKKRKVKKIQDDWDEPQDFSEGNHK